MAVIRPSKLKKRQPEIEEEKESLEELSLEELGNRIDTAIELANDKGFKTADKRRFLEEAQSLAHVYQKKCEAGGNNVKQFKSFI